MTGHHDHTISLGLALPQFVPKADAAKSIKTIARESEECGFAALWTSETLGGPILDPLLVLTQAASVTDRIRLGVAIILLALRTPVLFAREVNTLDVISQGRLTLGVGFGSNKEIYAEYGLPSDARRERYVNGIAVLRELLMDGSARYVGPEWLITGNVEIPSGIQQPHAPIWYGGHAEGALRRAVQDADGWIGSGSSAESNFLQELTFVKEELNRIGRDQSTFAIAKRYYVHVGNPDGPALQRARDWFQSIYRRPDLAETSLIWGSISTIREKIQEMAEIGVQHVVINPILDFESHLKLLACDVMPVLP